MILSENQIFKNCKKTKKKVTDRFFIFLTTFQHKENEIIIAIFVKKMLYTYKKKANIAYFEIKQFQQLKK